MQDHVEIEKKYIIEKPDREVLFSVEGCKSSQIVQIYLEAPAGKTHRVRKRTEDGVSVYTETVKVRIDRMSAFEDERRITEARFAELSGKIKEINKVLCGRGGGRGEMVQGTFCSTISEIERYFSSLN